MKKPFFCYLLTLAYIGLVVFGLFMLFKALNSLPLVLLIAVYFFNFNLVFIISFPKRNTNVKLIWIIVITLIPFVGHILFLMFGQIYFGRQDLKTYHQRRTFKYEVFSSMPDKLLDHQSRLSNRGVYNADLTFFANGNDAFNDLFQAIKEAKKHIHMHWYIIKPGEIYDHLKDLIIQKSRSGVTVRLIVDDFGSLGVPAHELNELKESGIKIKIFGKIVLPFINSSNFYRTHRKQVIIDSKIAYLGGLNIGDEYASLWHFYGRWLDLKVKITGGAVRSHVLLFIEDWKQMTSEWLDPQKYIAVSQEGANKTILVEDSPEISQNIVHDSFLNLIYNAKREIIIATPYFVPSEGIIDALKTAANKGVVIKIFVPGFDPNKFVLYISYHYVYTMLDTKIQFYKTQGTFLHTKAGIFDNEICYFGTMNFDKRSFYSQFELINLFHGPATKELNKLFQEYEKISVLMDKKPRFWNYRKWFSKFFVNMLSPLI